MADDKPVETLKETAIAVAKEAYPDLAKPAFVELGSVAGTLTGTVDALLMPLRMLVYSVDRIEQILKQSVDRKLRIRGVPAERLITPSAVVAGPVLQAMVFAGQVPELREMFAALLATAMDRDMAHKAHPAFVEIIRQLNPDEARVIDWMARNKQTPVYSVQTQSVQLTTKKTNKAATKTVLKDLWVVGEDAECAFPDLTPNYITNIMRLGLAGFTADEQEFRRLPQNRFVNSANGIKLDDVPPDKDLVLLFERLPQILQLALSYLFGEDSRFLIQPTVVVNRRILRLTDFGRQFCEACVDMEETPKQQSEAA